MNGDEDSENGAVTVVVVVTSAAFLWAFLVIGNLVNTDLLVPTSILVAIRCLASCCYVLGDMYRRSTCASNKYRTRVNAFAADVIALLALTALAFSFRELLVFCCAACSVLTTVTMFLATMIAENPDF